MNNVSRAADAAEPLTLEMLMEQFDATKKLGLKIDLTRGLPSPEQLALSDPMLGITDTHMDGIDCRNYGTLEGLPSARKLFGEYHGVPARNVFVLGNSSIDLMHQVVSQAMRVPVPGSRIAWGKMTQEEKGQKQPIKPIILCPVPGFDRHFSICESHGIKMIPINLTEMGPDMSAVRQAVRDPAVIGMWCMPKFSNPSAITYSRATIEELAEMEVANSGFRLLCDNAYAVHELTDEPDDALSLFEACVEADNPGRVFMFGSTSKITFAGGGVASIAASARNLRWFREGLATRLICPDKMNQLRHVEFLKDMDGIREHMRKHRELLAPKIKAVTDIFDEELTGTHLHSVKWTYPKGGYFVLLSIDDLAGEVLQLASELGITLLAPKELCCTVHQKYTDLRIAPSFAPLEDVRGAVKAIALCVKIVRKKYL